MAAFLLSTPPVLRGGWLQTCLPPYPSLTPPTATFPLPKFPTPCYPLPMKELNKEIRDFLNNIPGPKAPPKAPSATSRAIATSSPNASAAASPTARTYEITASIPYPPNISNFTKSPWQSRIFPRKSHYSATSSTPSSTHPALPGPHHQDPRCLGQAHKHSTSLHPRMTMPETLFVCPAFFETSPTPKTSNSRHELVFQNESVPRLTTLKRVPLFPTRS